MFVLVSVRLLGLVRFRLWLLLVLLMVFEIVRFVVLVDGRKDVLVCSVMVLVSVLLFEVLSMLLFCVMRVLFIIVLLCRLSWLVVLSCIVLLLVWVVVFCSIKLLVCRWVLLL